MSRFSLLFLGLLPVIAAGCAAGADAIDDTGAANDLASAEGALTTKYKGGWTQGNPPTRLAPTTITVSPLLRLYPYCFLTSVQGRFQGGGESVRVYSENGSWWIGGTSQQAGGGVGGYANCVTLPSTEYPFTRQYNVVAGQRVQMARATDADPAYRSICFLSRMQGRFEGAGEQIKTYIDSDNYWYLQATAAQPGVEASATCLSVLKSHSTSLPARPIAQTTVTSSMPPQALGVAYSKNTCGLLRVSGDFNGGGEVAETYGYMGNWFTRAVAGSGAGVTAEVGCL